DQVDDLDQLQSICNLIETTPRAFWKQHNIAYQWSMHAIAWCTYSAKTGIPLEWLTGDIVKQFLAGSLEGDVNWVKDDGTPHQNLTVDDLGEMVSSRYGS